MLFGAEVSDTAPWVTVVGVEADEVTVLLFSSGADTCLD